MDQMTLTQHDQKHRSSGGRLVAADGRELPFGGAEIEATACGGIAEVTLRHLFVNDGQEPLEATYQTPIPAGAAVGSYSFTVGDRRFVGEIDRRETARERYDEAIAEGRTAALLDEERGTFFTQHVGNIPPGAEVVCELRLDQRLDWAEGAWEWRFPTVIGPRYAGAEGRVDDAKTVQVDVLKSAPPARASFTLRIAEEAGEPTSPTHEIHAIDEAGDRIVSLADERGVCLDRDIVVSWPVAKPEVGVCVETARPASGSSVAADQYALLTITPPGEPFPAVPRDLILLLDTSGSMSGAPLERAKRVALGLIGSLGSQDRLEMVRFGSTAERWREAPVAGDGKTRTVARRWVEDLEAGGGTEMQEGLREALRPVRSESQRQVILITDGYVSFEREMVRLTRSYRSENVRVHAVGVGSAINRSLTGAIARIGGGCEFQLGLDENPAPAIARLVAHTAAPLITDLTLRGDALAEPIDLPDLMGGSPALAAVRLRSYGGSLVIRGKTSSGIWKQTVSVAPLETGSGRDLIRRLYARDLVDRFEIGESQQGDFDRQIERVGLEHRISTRMTSWIAVSDEATVDGREPSRRARIPQELPYGVSAEGAGLARPRQEDQRVEYCLKPKNVTARAMPDHARRRRVFHSDAEDSSTLLTHSRTRVTLRSGRLYITFDAERELEWRPDRVLLNNAFELEIDTQRSTRSGSIRRGRTVRIVCTDVPDGFTRADVRALRVLSRYGETVDLALEPRPE